jgi:hypothetical protein
MNKKIYALFGILLLAAGTILIAGCGSDPTISDTGAGAKQTYTFITGRVDNVTQTNCEVFANALGHLSTTMPVISVMPVTYDNATGTFEISNVPANDTIYIGARQHDACSSVNSVSYSYGRINVGTGVGYLAVTFEAQATVDADCNVPKGFNIGGYRAYVSRDGKPVLPIITMDGDYGNSIAISKLPKLLPGDSYIINFTEFNSDYDSLDKYFYNIGDGFHAFDISTPEVPATEFLISPPDGAAFTSAVPTFEWQEIPWAKEYNIWVYNSVSKEEWHAVTTGTKISMPADVAAAAGKGTFYWQVSADDNGTAIYNIFSNRILPGYTVQ